MCVLYIYYCYIIEVNNKKNSNKQSEFGACINNVRLEMVIYFC